MFKQVISHPNYLGIIAESGALAVMDNDLTLWKSRPPFNIPRLAYQSRASTLILETLKVKPMTWDELCALFTWQIREHIQKQVTGSIAKNDPPPTVLDNKNNWKYTLRTKLNPAYASVLSDVAIGNHIESVLRNPIINDYIRQRVDWLLVENATLLDLLMHNTGETWVQLVAILVEIAERSTGKMETSFPIVGSPRVALNTVIDICKKATPFVEYVLYSPLMLPNDRLAQWRATADSVMNQEQLITWIRLPKEMAYERLSQEQMNDFLAILTDKLNHDQQLRTTLIGLAKENKTNFTIAQFDNIESDIFKPNVQMPMAALNFGAQSNWPGAKKILATLNINNDRLAEELDECEASQYFTLRSKEEWPSQLTAMGAIGIQNLKVFDALVKLGLIK